MGKIDSIQFLEKENRKLKIHNGRLMLACESAKKAFLNLIDLDLLPAGKLFDNDTWKLIDEMDAAMSFTVEEDENGTE
jgi:hypothetical protein